MEPGFFTLCVFFLSSQSDTPQATVYIYHTELSVVLILASKKRTRIFPKMSNHSLIGFGPKGHAMHAYIIRCIDLFN